jgi:hypothetical protein
MEINIYTIIYTLGIGLLGYFLRDIYNPRKTLRYSYQHKTTSGTYPRIYTFKNRIHFKNIDTQPIYEVEINQTKNGVSINLKSLDNLFPNEEIIIEDQLEIPFEDTGNKPKEAEKMLPENFITPKLLVEFKNKSGHKYKSKFSK